ncbi:bombesin receptor-activated protein C6orf89-like, partial [Silurus asotus]
MGTTLSEPCIYDKLSESIHILRHSGYRYGMSEREIEKFIKQVLETNEPRREPTQFPVLRTIAKVVVVTCVLLGLAFVYAQCLPASGSGSAVEQYNWSSPLRHIRLLSLPIAKKYKLHSKISPPPPTRALQQCLHAWWSVSHTLRNCSGCSSVFTVSTLFNTVSLQTHTQPVLVKLKMLHSSHSGLLTILMDEGEEVISEVFPQSSANFSLLWCCTAPFHSLHYTLYQRGDSRFREEMFHSLFPSARLSPLLQSVGSTIQRCRITHTSSSQSQGECVVGWLLVGDGFPTVHVFPHQRCQTQCSSFNWCLEPGDLVYADPQFWQLEMFPGRGENVVCDG